MSYLALYRKYRPIKFNDIYGQEEIVTVLKNAIMRNKVSHAYLFSGPRGTGKTTIAKIIARLVNCENPIDGDACGKCYSCLNFLNSSDIVEIDAASNNGVDEIRELRDKINLVPTSSKYKVYIIDEVHMLTNQAFNALLKTLEEPPSHVIFILATTEPHKIPLTIASRCQKFRFSKISDDKIVDRLKEISKNENISISDDALFEIARISDGGMRDAINMLDQLVAFTNSKITLEDIYAVNGTVSYSNLFDLLKNIKDNDKIKYKLKPLVADDDVYRCIVEDRMDEITDKESNVLKNYQYISNRLNELLLQGYDANAILMALDKLYVVCVPISEEDNAQKIFESINATGVKLTSADLIRNYLLMDLQSDVQEKYYADYWKKLEDTELAEFLHVDTEKDWYYVENNDSKGPFSLEEMKSMISRGVLNNDSFVWKTGMQDWVRLKNTELAIKSPVAPVFTNTNTNTATSTYAYTSVKEKNIGLCILLSFVTCGFYCLYWLYCLAKDLNELCESQGQEKGSDGGLVLILSIVTCGIYQIYYMYKAGKLISSLTRSNGTHPSDDSVILLILSIFGLPLISYCIIQSNINDFAKN